MSQTFLGQHIKTRAVIIKLDRVWPVTEFKCRHVFRVQPFGLLTAVSLVAMLCDFGYAIHIVWVATFHFHLDRCVGNAEIVRQFFR